MQVGAIGIEPVSDGYVLAPAVAMFNKTAEDWEPHRQFLDDAGNFQIEMGGFLVRTGDRIVLVDTGIGPLGESAHTGMFMESLTARGVTPDEVTDVLLTHLHFDHLGWASDGRRPLFPRATYRCHEADWDFFMGDDPYDESLGLAFLGGRCARDLLPAVADRVETWGGEETLFPGVDVRDAPGHTPGSTIITLSSGTDRALLLGDAVHCPAELLTDDWKMVGDVDKALAARTREALAREIEGSDIPVAASHFPEMRFGRVLPGTGVRRWVFD